MDALSSAFQWIWQFLLDFWPVRVIAPGQQGVRLRHNGRADLLLPGVWLHWPRFWTIHEVDAQYQNVDCGMQSLTTIDEKEVTISLNVGYEIKDAAKQWVGFQNFDTTLSNLARGCAAEIISASPWDALLGSPKEVSDQILSALRKELANSGVKIRDVTMDQISRVKTIRLLQSQGF